ncbi:MAG: hypothetical protein WA419_10955, partial [Silvibacterium sp.]
MLNPEDASMLVLGPFHGEPTPHAVRSFRRGAFLGCIQLRPKQLPNDRSTFPALARFGQELTDGGTYAEVAFLSKKMKVLTLHLRNTVVHAGSA